MKNSKDKNRRTSLFPSSLLISFGGSILLLSFLVFIIIDPAVGIGISVVDDTSSTSTSSSSIEESVNINSHQKMSTGETPKDFVRNKIDSHDVSFKIRMLWFPSLFCVRMNYS